MTMIRPVLDWQGLTPISRPTAHDFFNIRDLLDRELIDKCGVIFLSNAVSTESDDLAFAASWYW